MRALIDTCVVVDALQSREPFADAAHNLFLLCANRQFEGFLTAKAITDICYLTHRLTHSDQQTRTILTRLCSLFQILDTSAQDIQTALSSDTSDFEDAVMIETAVRDRMDCIVTRNAKDYSKAQLNVYSPSEFVLLLTSEADNSI